MVARTMTSRRSCVYDPRRFALSTTIFCASSSIRLCAARESNSILRQNARHNKKGEERR